MEQKDTRDMTLEELWKVKSELLESYMVIPQQLKAVNSELDKRNKEKTNESISEA